MTKELLQKIEASIVVPDKFFFVKNENTFRLHWMVYDQPHYLCTASSYESACFLLENGVIDDMKIDITGKVTMYKNIVLDVYGANGQPVQYVKPRIYSWSEIDFDSIDAKRLAFNQELKRLNESISMPDKAAKVIKMAVNKYFKRIA